MALARPPDGPSHSDPEEVLYRFDQAWLSGVAPRIDEFLPAEGAARRELLEELVKIDLECRWRLAAPGEPRPRLEDYATRYPELLRPSVGLIAEEYQVRRRWGDRPAHDEYAARF